MKYKELSLDKLKNTLPKMRLFLVFGKPYIRNFPSKENNNKYIIQQTSSCERACLLYIISTKQ